MTQQYFARFFALCFIISSGILFCLGATTANSILDSASAKFRSAKSLKAAYTITADGQNQSGTLTLSGDRFVISSPQISSWYDGKTQWTYSTHTGEINITEPTPEELQQVNPFAIISSFRKLYKAVLLKSPSSEKKIRLTANDPHADISSVELTLNSNTLYPSLIEMTLSNKRKVTIKVTTVTPGAELPISTFRFEKSRFPGVPIVDLR